MSYRLFSGGLVLASALLAGAARAAVVEWTFSDAFLADGSAVTGSFEYNADTNLYSNVNISVAGSTNYPAATFTHAILYGEFTGSGELDTLESAYPGGDMAGYEQLFFIFGSNLTNAGGSVAIANTPISPQLLTCGDANCQTANPNFPQLNGSQRPGSITASIPGGVPEPATWTLMLGGFGLAGAALRRRRMAVGA